MSGKSIKYDRILLTSHLTCGLMILAFSHVFSQQPTEYQVKAVYIYNLVNFVEWPPSVLTRSSDEFVIGIAGPSAFENLVTKVVSGEKYQGRPIRIQSIATAPDAEKCHVVFVSAECDIARNILAETDGKPILTIGEKDDFLHHGGMVRFYVSENKVKIEVNHRKASDHQLRISSKLLQLAKIFESK